MKTTRLMRLLSLLLALLMLCPLAAACKKKDDVTEQPLPEETSDEPEVEGDGFVPVLRFVAASDIHTRVDGYDQATADEINAAQARLRGLFTVSYADAQSNPYYQKLDAVVLVGDYTDRGNTLQYEQVKKAVNKVRNDEETQLLACLGNHEFWYTGENGSLETDTTKTYANFVTYFGRVNQNFDPDQTMGPDYHTVINGFHFIGISPDAHGGRSYSLEKAKWLKAELEIAKADDPTKKKPIFVYMHIPPNTLDAEETYSTMYAASRLNTYPQAVVISGHTHQPVVDPSSLTQNNYTLLNTGTMGYTGYAMYINQGTEGKGVAPLGLEGAYVSDTSGDPYTEHGERETAVFTIIEVDAKNRMRVRYYDLNADAFLGEPLIIASIGQQKSFEYTTLKRKANTPAPSWAEDAAVTELAVTPTTARLSFPQAVNASTVRNYQLNLSTETGYVTTIYRLSRYDTALMPERLTAPFSGLQPDTTYTVTIYAYNCYGVQSIGEPLAYTFRTPADDGAPVPEVFSAAFDATGATDKISGATLKKDGAVTYDAEMQAAKFTREGGYMWNGIASYYDLMKTSVTLEAVVKRTGIPDGETAGILSNYNTEITNGRISGGMSLEYNRAGRVVFRIYLKNLGVRTLVSATVLPTGRFAHVVATYDGHTMKIYIDGELDATSANDTSSVNYEGEIWFPWKSAEQNLVIGGTGSYGTTYTSARRMNGLVRTANVYARALNESQIRALATPYIAT